MNIAEGIQLDRVLRGTREFSAELVMLEHMFDHPAHGMAKSSASLVGTGTPARRPAASRQPASRADGGDAPAWSSRRHPYQPPPATPVRRDQGGRGRLAVSYAELHCPNASFLDGDPIPLAEEAARLGLEALAITDHDGMYGIVRFAEAARALSLPTIFGAELTLTPAGALAASGARTGTPDPAGEHLVVLARGPEVCAAEPGHLGGADGQGGAPGELGRLAGLHGGTGWS